MLLVAGGWDILTYKWNFFCSKRFFDDGFSDQVFALFYFECLAHGQ